MKKLLASLFFAVISFSSAEAKPTQIQDWFVLEGCDMMISHPKMDTDGLKIAWWVKPSGHIGFFVMNGLLGNTTAVYKFNGQAVKFKTQQLDSMTNFYPETDKGAAFIGNLFFSKSSVTMTNLDGAPIGTWSAKGFTSSWKMLQGCQAI